MFRPNNKVLWIKGLWLKATRTVREKIQNISTRQIGIVKLPCTGNVNDRRIGHLVSDKAKSYPHIQAVHQPVFCSIDGIDEPDVVGISNHPAFFETFFAN